MTERDMALRARSELPMANRALDLLEAQIIAQWTEQTTTEQREAAFYRLRAVREVRLMMVAAAAQADINDHADALQEQGFQP